MVVPGLVCGLSGAFCVFLFVFGVLGCFLSYVVVWTVVLMLGFSLVFLYGWLLDVVCFALFILFLLFACFPSSFSLVLSLALSLFLSCIRASQHQFCPVNQSVH